MLATDLDHNMLPVSIIFHLHLQGDTLQATLNSQSMTCEFALHVIALWSGSEL